jgi:hypothetical protein
MAQPAADRNLLFGILALQMDFITRDDLIAAMHAWVLDKAKPLGHILRDQGHLSAERLQLLEALVQEHLRAHGNDPEQSLAALNPAGPVRQDLEQIADPDLHASLAHVGGTPADRGPEATGPHIPPGTLPPHARFQILRPHARGGLGQVFVARDEELKREVALKEIQEQHAANPEARARFLLEAEVTGGLEHPGIVPVYGLGHYADGRPFYAMRFVKGDSLKDAIARFHQGQEHQTPGERTLALRKLLGRFVDVCQAIEYAHSRGVLHRDLKPGNILVGTYGETLVVDWGLAKVLGRAEVEISEGLLSPAGGDSGLTQAGAALGTPAYMSPEQAAGRLDRLGPASDVYGLGATLYHLLTGRAPFAGPDQGEILRQVRTGAFQPPRKVDRRIPAGLEAVCLKAMSLQPEDRYPSPRALADDVERWLADEPVSARREPLRERAWRFCRRRPVIAAWLGFAAADNLVVIVALVGLLVWRQPLAAAPFLGLAWAIGVVGTVTFVAQLVALLGAALGAALGAITAAVRPGGVKERAARGVVAGGKGGIIVGAVLGYALSVYGLYIIRKYSSYSSYDDASAVMVLALCAGLLGPALGFTLGAIRKAKREILLRRVWRGTVSGAILGAGVAAVLFSVDLLRPTSEAARQKHRQFGGASLPTLPRPTRFPDVGPVPAPEGVEDAMQRFLLVQEKLAHENPTVEAYVGLGSSYSALGRMVCERGKPQDALDWYGKALRTLQAALRTEPGHVKAREALRDGYRGRAEAFARLGRHAESLADWDRALETDTWPDRNELLLQHAQALARVGDYAKATAEAQALAEGKDLPGGVLYTLAQVYARSAAAVRAGRHGGPALPQAEREKLTGQYAARAIALLRRAQEAGFFKLPANVARMKGDRDLDLLREHEAFKKLRIGAGAKD